MSCMAEKRLTLHKRQVRAERQRQQIEQPTQQNFGGREGPSLFPPYCWDSVNKEGKWKGGQNILIFGTGTGATCIFSAGRDK